MLVMLGDWDYLPYRVSVSFSERLLLARQSQLTPSRFYTIEFTSPLVVAIGIFRLRGRSLARTFTSLKMTGDLRMAFGFARWVCGIFVGALAEALRMPVAGFTGAGPVD
jgi:hypothetical protein